MSTRTAREFSFGLAAAVIRQHTATFAPRNRDI
jgi:hypothetical protein